MVLFILAALVGSFIIMPVSSSQPVQNPPNQPMIQPGGPVQPNGQCPQYGPIQPGGKMPNQQKGPIQPYGPGKCQYGPVQPGGKMPYQPGGPTGGPVQPNGPGPIFIN